jgi:hypothetical protein
MVGVVDQYFGAHGGRSGGASTTSTVGSEGLVGVVVFGVVLRGDGVGSVLRAAISPTFQFIGCARN